VTYSEQSIKNLISEADQIISEVQKKSPADVDVFSVRTKEVRIVYENKDYSVSTNHTSTQHGIRCIRQGQMGFVTTNASTSEGLKQAAEEVNVISELTPSNEFQCIAKPPSTIGHFESIDIKMAQLSPQELAKYADELIQTATSDKRVSIDRAEINWSLSEWSLASSNSFVQSAASSTCSWFVMGMGKTDTEVTSFDYDGGTVKFESEIIPLLNKTVGYFRDSVVSAIGARSGKSYRGPVILHPQAVMDLIGDFISSNCHGLRQQDGMSSWKDMMGELVAHKDLLVLEDPLNVNRIEGWSPFDREGVPSSLHKLIDCGRLNFVAHNCFTAQRAGVDPTGNASGGSRSLPGIGFSNLSVSAQPQASLGVPEEKLFSMISDGLMVKRFSGNSDPTSGQFSGIAKNSHWISGGQIAYPVHEVMISGNMFDLIREILAIASSTHHIYGGGVAPYILVDGVSVTAGS